jgi:thiamine-phosphate pyrophosphorylase
MDSSAITPEAPLRIIDANLNRIGEGLRLLEDVARFLLDDAILTRQLKVIRHNILELDWPANWRLLQHRNSEEDTGIDLSDAQKKRELPLIVVANARRVQESLRVIEELAKAPGGIPGLEAERFKQARFDLYAIEQRLLSQLLREEKVQQIRGLYLILRANNPDIPRILEVADQAVANEVRVLHLQYGGSGREFLALAVKLKELCSSRNVLFVIQDRVDVAIASNADGICLGPDSLPVSVARRILPQDKVLGCLAATPEQAAVIQEEGADYIMIDLPGSPLGVKALSRIREVVTVPIVAISGINVDNTNVISMGANALAITTDISDTSDVGASIRRLAAYFEQI